MKTITGIVGSGMVGNNPFDPYCWSRSGFNLFLTLRARGCLHRAFGVEVPHPMRGLLMARNFYPRRKLWAQRFNLDPGYYGQLTRQIRKGLRRDDFIPDNVLLQIGGHYNAREAAGGRIAAYSYHDGNIGGMMRSPFFPSINLPHARKAFEFEKGVYRDMAKIFVMSEYWRRSFIEEFGVEPGRVENVGVGANVEIPPAFVKDYSRKEILFVGINFARKGGDHLVAAFRRVSEKHPTARLHIVGPREMPSALSSPGLRNVVFHGRLSREVASEKALLVRLWRDCTLFVLPSLYEPFGIAALEAMLNGMPVIATNNWSFPDFVTAETGLLLDDPADREEFAAKLDAFLSDPDRTARAGAAGRALVAREYTWDRVVDRIMRGVEGRCEPRA